MPGNRMAGARITARLSPRATQHTKGGDSTEAVAAFFHIHNCPAPTPEGSRKGRIAVPHGPYGTAIRQGLQGHGMKAKGHVWRKRKKHCPCGRLARHGGKGRNVDG